MKLQINDAGSWRHISNFDRLDEPTVRVRAAQLAVALNERTKLRILDDKNNPRAHCKGPEFTWEEWKQ